MPNFGKIIKSLNKKTINNYTHKRNELVDSETKKSQKGKGRPKYLVKKDCNCEKSHPCPLENKCNKFDVVYKAEIQSQNLQENGKFYIGSASTFKDRWSNHISTFNNRENNQVCALKDHIWDLKDRKVEFTIEWSITKQSKSYKSGDKTCLLCLDEKLCIMESSKNPKLINKDLYLGAKCLHKNKFLINNWKKRKNQNV